MKPVGGRATPYLAVDVARLRRNIGAMARWAAERGIALRPHVKTHKCAEIARLQLRAGAVGITVATLGEAEVFADAGCRDIFVAYPLWPDQRRLARLVELSAQTTLRVGIDSVEAARGLARAGDRVGVLIEVDSGHHRTGVPPADAGALAAAATRSGLTVSGVFTFPGHSYHPDGRARAAADEARALATAAAALREVGVDPVTISGGSTPSIDSADTSVLTEARPGVYAFGDAQQWALGATTPDRIALTCVATVVSHAGGRAVVDSGSKILGADRPPYVPGFGRVLDHPDAVIGQLSEHHAVIEFHAGPLPALGSTVAVVPNHVCSAVNLVDSLVAEEERETREWRVAARGCNS